jgi:hypothetical protein
VLAHGNWFGRADLLTDNCSHVKVLHGFTENEAGCWSMKKGTLIQIPADVPNSRVGVRECGG